jgi:PII-like signaling protein
MRVLDGEQILMRIFIGEADKAGKKPLYQSLVEFLRHEGIAGATVLRGVAGFGAKSHLHRASILRLSQDLPIVVEVVDSQVNIERILPQLDEMVLEGLITMEKVRVLKYGPGSFPGADFRHA